MRCKIIKYKEKSSRILKEFKVDPSVIYFYKPAHSTYLENLEDRVEKSVTGYHKGCLKALPAHACLWTYFSEG